MAFFPPLSAEDSDERPAAALPEWLFPPDAVVGGPMFGSVDVAYTDRVFISVERLVVYPNGLTFTLRVLLRGGPEIRRGPFRHPGKNRWPEGPPDLDEVLRIGVEYPDGSRVADPIDLSAVADLAEPDSPVLVPRRGSWGARGGEEDLWLTPEPPPGPLRIVVAWPALALPETTARIEAQALAEARRRIRHLWPDDS